jgi:hypothetical protein
MRVSIPRLDVTQSRTLSSSKLRFLFTSYIIWDFQSKNTTSLCTGDTDSTECNDYSDRLGV